MRFISILLAAILTASAASAEVFLYETENASLSIEEDFHDCGVRAEGELRHPFPGLHDDPQGLQQVVRELAMLRFADCGLTRVLDLRLYGTEHVSEITVGSADFWQLPALRRPEAEASSEASAAQTRLAEILAAPAGGNNPLAHRGWARSTLLYREDAFRLYAGFASGDSDRAELIMVFADKRGAEFFPTAVQQRERNNITIVPGPEYFAMLDRGLSAAGPPFWRSNIIRHYLEGYYIPYKNREAELAKDGVVEEAIYRMNYGRYWDGTAMRVTPIPMLDLGYEAAPEDLLIDRERLEIRYGPSAPGPDGASAATVAALPEEPADGYLPEGPSPRRLFQRRAVREATIERGLIFLNDGFWARFSSSDVQRIFEAHADYLSVGDPGFSALVMHFLDRNGTRCGHVIDEPTSWQLKEITVKVDEQGNATSDETVIWDLVVPARFVPHLERKFNASGPGAVDTIGASVDLMRPGGLAGMARDVAASRREVEETIEDVERIMELGECGNVFLVQFEEMLFLHLADLNPEDHTTLSFEEPKRVAMDFYEPGSAKRLKTACLAADDFLGKRDDWRRCSCIEEKMASYRPERSEFYTRRFQRLFPDVRSIRQDPARRSPDDIALVNVWHDCMNAR